jgi:hypothetical protein
MKLVSMKLHALIPLAAAALVSLSACGGGNTAGALGGVPVANAIVPLTSTVMVKAVLGKNPIFHLEITVTRTTWPNGKLITKGKTGPMGRVTLSGNWTGQELICVGGKYVKPPRTYEASHCERPFPRSVTLDFQQLGYSARESTK